MTRCMGCMREYDGSTEVCPHCGYVRGTAAREAYHLAPESILQGRYIVGRVLGFGGFGVTYIGWDAQLERVVAIKEFLPTSFATRMPGGTAVTVYEGGATEQFGFGLHRFVEEAQRLAQFNGIRGITDIYDTFSGNNTAYIVMEYLKGRDVKEILTAEGPLSYERAREIVLRVCDTLAPVHQKGIIHRDISPDNIYLTDDGEVKLLDFGAARYESSVNSKSLSVILKAGYAPEEQYRSRGDQGPWTDVYALAATFYKMLTGATPPDSMERAVRDELKEPSKAGAQLPKSAENAILNALNLRKADRTQSVEAFKEALQSDGVERVKAKARRGGGGKVPVPAIVAMGVAGLLLVAFFALGATGVVDLGGGTALPDTFGTAGQNGKAVVPNLDGMSAGDARAALEAVGLVMAEGPAVNSVDTPVGTVLEQQPRAGKELAEGETVTVTLCGQSLESMLASAENGLPAWQAEYLIASVPIRLNLGEGETTNNYSSSPYYEFSDTVPEGCVTRYVKLNEQRVNLWISAGKDDVTSDSGEIRGVYLHNNYGEGGADGGYAEIEYALALPADDPAVFESGGWNERGVLTFHASTDGGATWQEFNHRGEPIRVSSGGRSGSSEEEGTPGNLIWIGMSLGSTVVQAMPQLAGQTLALRVDYHAYVPTEDLNNGAPGEVLRSVVLDQTYTLELEDPPLPAITGSEVVGWDEVQRLIDSGEISEHHPVAFQYLNNVLPRESGEDGGYEYYTVYRLLGDFVADEYYAFATYVYTPSEGYLSPGYMDSVSSYSCEKDGELLIIQYTSGRYQVGTGERSCFELYFMTPYGRVQSTCDENGHLTNVAHTPSRAMMVFSQLVADWDGATPLDQLVESTPVPPGQSN